MTTTMIEIARGEEWPADWRMAAGLTSLDAETWRRHTPDLHIAIADAGAEVRARCSCWWSDTPRTSDAFDTIGVIGHYAAADDAEAGVRVLHEACARLAAHGCTRVVGPMDGNTWRTYRLVIDRSPEHQSPEPPFFLEPDTPDAWVSHFRDAGFSVLATYTSALATDLSQRDERLAALDARLRESGVTIRTLDLGRADEDLRRIHALSLVSFRDNVFYTPLDDSEFLEQNKRLLPFVRPELVLLAERHDGGDRSELVGFLFAIPDVLRARGAGGRAPKADTIILKTVAVRPGLRQAGLGSLLVAEAQQRAAALGYTRAIHALMHERNVSRNISRRYAATIRRYALFERRLTA